MMGWLAATELKNLRHLNDLCDWFQSRDKIVHAEIIRSSPPKLKTNLLWLPAVFMKTEVATDVYSATSRL